MVRPNYYTTDVDLFFAHYGEVVTRLAEVGCRPSSTLLAVSRLAFPELMVGMEATTVR